MPEENSSNLILYGPCIILQFQQDIQRFMIKFIHNTLEARHVSDLNGPSSGAFSSCMLQIWYVAVRVLLDMSRCYAVVGITAFFLRKNTTYQICNIQLENAPEDGLLRHETCRAAKCYE